MTNFFQSYGGGVGVGPLGGVSDDGPRLTALFAKYAGELPVHLLPGTYNIATPVELPSNLILIGDPRVLLAAALPSVPLDPSNAIFVAQAGAVVSASTVHADVIKGSATIVSNSTFPVDSILIVGSVPNPFHVSIFTVLSVSGVGPFTITVDRPVVESFVVNDTITHVLSQPTNIHIFGNGMKLSGAATRYVEIAASYRCSVQDCYADTSAGAAVDYYFSFDVGGRENLFRDVHVDCDATAGSIGIALESNERSVIDNCRILNAAGYGYLLLDCVSCDVIDSSAAGCLYGLSFNADGNNVGCASCHGVGGSFDGNSQAGILVTSGSSFCSFAGFTSNYNGVYGVFLDGTGTLMTSNRFERFDARGNGNYGVRILAGTKDTTFADFDVSDAGTAGASLVEDAMIFGMRAKSTTGAPALAVGSGIVFVDGATFIDTAATTDFVIAVSGGQLVLTRANVKIGPGNYGLVTSGTGVADVSHSVFKPNGGSAGETGLANNAPGATIRLGEAVDCDGCATPFVALSGQLSRGQVIANGAVAVDVAWPDLKSSDRVALSMRTKGGTPTAMPQIAYTPGSKFTITSYLLDASTYNYVVE